MVAAMDYDAIIVGAGPAGTAAAYRLSEQGKSVLMLDRKTFPRMKPCAGGLTLKALKLIPYSVGPILERSTDGMTVGLRSNCCAIERQLSNGNTICTFAVRAAFDQFNFERAVAAGADFLTVRAITEITQSDHCASLRADGKWIRARYLIGADGVNGVVRRLCASGGTPVRGFALEGLIPYAAIGQEPRAELYFGVVDHGYGWLFPKGDHVNVGIYTCSDQVALSKERLRAYCRDRLGGDRVEHMVGFPIGFGGDRFRPRLGRVVLVGDAGGFAEPLLGEGLHNAIKTGQEAAQAILDTDEAGQHPERMAARFDKRARRVRVDVSRCRRLAFRLFYPNLRHFGARALDFPIATSALLNGFSAGKTMREITNTFPWSAFYKPIKPQSLLDFEASEIRLAA